MFMGFLKVNELILGYNNVESENSKGILWGLGVRSSSLLSSS